MPKGFFDLSDENEDPSTVEEKVVTKKPSKQFNKKTFKTSAYGLGEQLGSEILKHHSSDDIQGSPDFKIPEPKLVTAEEEDDGEFIVTRKLIR